MVKIRVSVFDLAGGLWEMKVWGWVIGAGGREDSGLFMPRSKLMVGKAFNHLIQKNSFTRLNKRHLLT